MKKYIAFTLLAFVLSFNVSYGATREELLQNMIDLLKQQVVLLIEQLNQIRAQEAFIQPANTVQFTGTEPQQLVGEATLQVNNKKMGTLEIYTSEMWGTDKPWLFSDTSDSTTVRGQYTNIQVFYKNPQGKYEETDISMAVSGIIPANIDQNINNVTKHTSYGGVPGHTEGQQVKFQPKFFYNGTYTITFSVGDVTNSVDIEIKGL